MEGRSIKAAVAETGARLVDCERSTIAFRAVNRRSDPFYRADMQRHHLLPRQLLGASYFSGLFAAVGPVAIGFDDFRANGLLLPSSSSAALDTGLPLHRGPHRIYNELVADRVGRVEAGWRRNRLHNPATARVEALMRLQLLQMALRKRLLQREGKLARLNRKDPFRAGIDFTELDALAEALWAVSAPRM